MGNGNYKLDGLSTRPAFLTFRSASRFKTFVSLSLYFSCGSGGLVFWVLFIHKALHHRGKRQYPSSKHLHRTLIIFLANLTRFFLSTLLARPFLGACRYLYPFACKYLKPLPSYNNLHMFSILLVAFHRPKVPLEAGVAQVSDGFLRHCLAKFQNIFIFSTY